MHSIVREIPGKVFYIHEGNYLFERKPRPGVLTLASVHTCLLGHGSFEGTRVHGCTHLSEYMPYRDPARRAAWMREYRKRKRVGKTSAPASVRSTLSGVRAPDPSRVSQQTVVGSAPQPSSPKSGPVRKRPRNSFKTALELARIFPFGVLASQACPYCYNTGYSSPGTRCSYCRKGER